jgi:hypothetical protein
MRDDLLRAAGTFLRMVDDTIDHVGMRSMESWPALNGRIFRSEMLHRVSAGWREEEGEAVPSSRRLWCARRRGTFADKFALKRVEGTASALLPATRAE